MTEEREWWKEGVVYQIYPRSFNDSDGDARQTGGLSSQPERRSLSGDGVGDIPGIVEKLDYLDYLDVDAVWLNPVYDSPLADQGYDVRDHRAILPEYGTFEDWRRLRDGLHDRGIRLIMDLVVNHTSDEHDWFQRSRREEDPYTDYYVWRDGDPDEPPNNWESLFEGPAWTYDDERGAWYLHLFDPKQPDLNWRNPAVREDVYDLMRWWLDRGVDGFRMDVINLLAKRDGLPDGTDDTAPALGWEHFVSAPPIHEYVQEMHEKVLRHYDVMTVGEALDVSIEDARRFVVEDGLDMVFTFEHMYLDEIDGRFTVGDWDLADLEAVTKKWQTGLSEGWNSLYLGNHDQPRIVSRFGDDGEYRRESAKLLATYLFTLEGTPFVYQGDELGMTNPQFDSVKEYRDVETTRAVELALEAGDVEQFENVREAVNYWTRDNARTPMQWSDAPNAGFTDGDPWIEVNEDYPEVNVERQRRDPDSVLAYYRRLVALRHEHPVLTFGDYAPILEEHDEVMAYLRSLDGHPHRALVLLNFLDGRPHVELPPGVEYDHADLLCANYDVADPDPRELDLRPYEARVYRLE
jgi:oligo-1,6-glucosidase